MRHISKELSRLLLSLKHIVNTELTANDIEIHVGRNLLEELFLRNCCITLYKSRGERSVEFDPALVGIYHS